MKLSILLASPWLASSLRLHMSTVPGLAPLLSELKQTDSRRALRTGISNVQKMLKRHGTDSATYVVLLAAARACGDWRRCQALLRDMRLEVTHTPYYSF